MANRKRHALAIGLGIATLPLLTPSATYATDTSTQKLTIFFSRAIWTQGKNCTPDPQSSTLEDAVKYAYERNVKVTIGVVTDRIGDVRGCPATRNLIQPSWGDLHRLVDEYNVEVVSQTKSYESTVGKDEGEVMDETCGSLDVLEDKGFDRVKASSMMAWGNSQYDDNGVSVAGGCFTYQRIVGNGRNYYPPESGLVTSQSVNGGYCVNINLSCNVNGMARPYTQPSQMYNFHTTKPAWKIIQFYWLVNGESNGKWDNITWSCNGPVTDHWFKTGGTHEGYCMDDYRKFVDWASVNVESVTPSEVNGLG